MAEPETMKKRKRKMQVVILNQQEEESPALAELVEASESENQQK